MGEAAGRELRPQLGNPGLQRAAFDRDVQIADPQVHQLVVGPGRPFRLCHGRLPPAVYRLWSPLSMPEAVWTGPAWCDISLRLNSLRIFPGTPSEETV